MRLLLDTHLVLWWQAGSSKLPSESISLVEQADVVFVSKATLWEVAIKVSIGKLKLDLEKFCYNVDKTGFQWLDIKKTHLITVASLPTSDAHKDPFDRLLIAQSQSEPLLLLTADQQLVHYGEMVKIL